MMEIQTVPMDYSAFTRQPLSHKVETDSVTATACNSSDIETVDHKSVYYFRHLIRKYRKQMGDRESTEVCSGGLQQYLNKQNEKKVQEQREREQSGQSQSKFENLPVDVRLHIFSYLSAIDLCRLSRVCKSWYDITEDNLLWQGILERDLPHWNVIRHNTNPQLYKDVQSELSTKEIYLRCSPEVNRLMHQQNSMFSNITSIIRYFLPKKTPMFAMFGPGLETSTSKIVRCIMNSETFHNVAMFPGRFGGVGGGFTLKTSSSQFHLSILYSSSRQEREKEGWDHTHGNKLIKENQDKDATEKYELVPAVQDFCRTVDGFVYVANASADSPAVETGLAELSAMVSERWSATYIPVLVLSTVLDADTPRLSCSQVVSRLQLGTMNRPWQVCDCVATTLDGIQDGFTWLSEQTQRR